MAELNNCRREFANANTYIRMRLHLQNAISEAKLKAIEGAKTAVEKQNKA